MAMNYMFLDLIASLEWVQRNIAEFGGDPQNVTIFGVSGGGRKTAYLMASPLTKGLFHRAIFVSGGGDPPENLPGALPLSDMEAMGERLFTLLGVDGEQDPLAAARAIPWEDVCEAEQVLTDQIGTEIDLSHLAPGVPFLGMWDVTVDGWFLNDAPHSTFRTGEYNAVPIITAASVGELLGPGFTLPLIPDYVNMLAANEQAGVPGYACIYDSVPAGLREQGQVSSHGMIIHYVFGDWDNTFGSWGSEDPGLTDVDEKVSKEIMAMWTQFAKTGDPNVEGLVTWPVWEAATDQYLLFVEPLQVKSGLSKIVQE